MAIYRGVIKGNTVVLEEPVELPDGAVVEVRPVAAEPEEPDERAREEAFERHLLEIGLISRIPTHEPDPPGLNRAPIPILSGPLVSETIIEERR
jgi:hypothetical protein